MHDRPCRSDIAHLILALIFSPKNPESNLPHGRWEGGLPRPGTGLFGIALFLASLTMLFGASIVGYLVIRSQTPDWPPPGMPGTTWGVLLSTALLLLSSGTMHAALRAIRRDSVPELRRWLAVTFLLGTAFLGLQLFNWSQLLVPEMDGRMRNLFLFLTVVHALHVVGGLIPMAVVWRRAGAGAYGATAHWGVLYCGIYWHFLDVVWLTLFGTLYLLG